MAMDGIANTSPTHTVPIQVKAIAIQLLYTYIDVHIGWQCWRWWWQWVSIGSCKTGGAIGVLVWHIIAYQCSVFMALLSFSCTTHTVLMESYEWRDNTTHTTVVLCSLL